MTHPKQTLTPGQAAREAYERTIVLGEMRETSELAWQEAAAAAIEAFLKKQSGDLVSREELEYLASGLGPLQSGDEVRDGLRAILLRRNKLTPPTENKDERGHRHFPFVLDPSDGERSYCEAVIHALTDYWRDCKAERVLYASAFMRQRSGFRAELDRVTLERDALGAVLLDVQKECAAADKAGYERGRAEGYQQKIRDAYPAMYAELTQLQSQHERLTAAAEQAREIATGGAGPIHTDEAFHEIADTLDAALAETEEKKT